MTAIRSPANAELICTRIEEGFTLRQIARELNCVASSITDWRREDDAFAARYARAKEVQADHFAEEIAEIADDGSNDWMKRELESGAIVKMPDHEHISRSRLRVDTRKWLMAKMAPKRYGDKQEIAHTGKVDVLHDADPDRLAQALGVIIRAGQRKEEK